MADCLHIRCEVYESCQIDDDGEPSHLTCPRCGSLAWVSVSLDGGWTRRAQCVPCGAHHPGSIGPGWRSLPFADSDATGQETSDGR